VDVLAPLICFGIFLVLAGCGLVLVVIVIASFDVGVVIRALRRRRFGLKTALGSMAFIGVMFALAAAMGVDFSYLGSVWALLVVVPFALFIVTFVGLALTELFDARSTRELVARRHQEDELAAYAKERRRMSEEDAASGGEEEAGDRTGTDDQLR
jgi:hypothetical protein